MNTGVRLVLVILVVVVLGASLLLSGAALSRALAAPAGYGMMGGYSYYDDDTGRVYTNTCHGNFYDRAERPGG